MSAALRADGVPARSAVSIASIAAGVVLDDLPDRELTEAELLELASSVAADPSRWADEVAYDDDERHFVCIHRDSHVDIWLICWTPSNDTGWHDHDISSGSVVVVRGSLVEHNLAIGTESIVTTVRAGRAFSFGPDHIHRLTGRDHRSVSVHAYSPPLWRMGQYAVATTGALRRVSVSYADELRPIEDALPAEGNST